MGKIQTAFVSFLQGALAWPIFDVVLLSTHSVQVGPRPLRQHDDLHAEIPYPSFVAPFGHGSLYEKRQFWL